MFLLENDLLFFSFFHNKLRSLEFMLGLLEDVVAALSVTL